MLEKIMFAVSLVFPGKEEVPAIACSFAVIINLN